jgi:hypothetical protein
VLSAVPRRLQGQDFTLAILDEFGHMDREVYEAVTLASGKQPASTVVGSAACRKTRSAGGVQPPGVAGMPGSVRPGRRRRRATAAGSQRGQAGLWQVPLVLARVRVTPG